MPADARSLLRVAASVEESEHTRRRAASTSKRKQIHQADDDSKRQRHDDRGGHSSQEEEEWRRFQDEVLLAPALQTAYQKAHPIKTTKPEHVTIEAPPALRSDLDPAHRNDDAKLDIDDIDTIEKQETDLQRTQIDLLARVEDEERALADSALRVSALRARLAGIKRANKSHS